MPVAAEYSRVNDTLFSADETAHSLLSQDEKDYDFEQPRPTHRRRNFALKGVLLFLALVLHASLIVALTRWYWPTASAPSSMATGEDNADGVCLMRDAYERQHSIEGTPRDDYKNPEAEFLQTDPCGSTAAEARARGCRFGMLYGAWLPEECYDEESEENFRKHTEWKFWLQPNRTEELTWDEVSKGEHDYVLVEWECKWFTGTSLAVPSPKDIAAACHHTVTFC
jgi:hypothetical protein